MAETYQLKHTGEQIDALLDKARTAVQPTDIPADIATQRELSDLAQTTDERLSDLAQATDAKLTELSAETSHKVFTNGATFNSIFSEVYFVGWTAEEVAAITRIAWALDGWNGYRLTIRRGEEIEYFSTESYKPGVNYFGLLNGDQSEGKRGLFVLANGEWVDTAEDMSFNSRCLDLANSPSIASHILDLTPNNDFLVNLEFAATSKAIHKDGYIADTNSNWAYTKPIAVKKGDLLKIKTAGNAASAVMAKTDANGSFYETIISYDSALLDYAYMAEFDGYVAMTIYTQRSYHVYKISSPIVSRLAANTATKAELSELATKAELSEVAAEIGNANTNYISGSSINRAGSLSTFEGWNATDFIPLEAGVDVEWQYGSANTEARLATYDVNKVFINSFGANVAGGKRTLLASSSEFVNAKYIRASFSDSVVDSVVVKIGNFEWKPTEGKGLLKDVSDIKSEINTLNERVSIVEDAANGTFVKNGEIVILDNPFSNLSIEGQFCATGKNLVDAFVLGSIIGDDGNAYPDNTSCYCDRFILVNGVQQILSNNLIQRIMIYDKYKNFIRRSDKLNSKLVQIPSDAYYIRIQVQTIYIDEFCLVYDGLSTEYEPFVDYTNNLAKASAPIVVTSTDGNPISVSYEKGEKEDAPIYHYITEEYPIFDDTSIPDTYKCRSGYEIATLPEGYSLETHLANFFDCYAFKTYKDYAVIKRTLGQDAAKSYFEMYYYEFVPKNYGYTIILSAGMNCCEIAAIFGLSYFIKNLMESDDSGLKAIKDSCRIIVLPFICPSSFEERPLRYTNANGVRINKNFNYLKSWDVLDAFARGTKGEYPDSEVETRQIKHLLSLFAGADLWIDCHQDLREFDSAKNVLFQAVCSSNSVVNKLPSAQNKMIAYYTEQGYISDATTPYVIWNMQATLQDYPKQLYSEKVLGIPSLMIEQFSSCNQYGGERDMQCESYGIRNYVTMIRQYILEILKK